MGNLLLKPIQIGGLHLKNRIVQSAMGTNFGDPDGFVTQRNIDYYEARARGGTGLIIAEFTAVHPHGRTFHNQLQIGDDKYIHAMQRLTNAVHQYGAKIALQIHHGGNKCNSRRTGALPLAPSPLPYLGGPPGTGGEVPREMTVEDIRAVVGYFANAAVRAKKAGFDGVELHAGHSYLIDHFISPATNLRTDEYGGSVENRARFLTEILQAVKSAVGKDFPVWCRLNGREFGVKGGTTVEDAQQIAVLAEKAGADMIHVSAAGPTSPVNTTDPVFVPAVLAELAEGIKRLVKVPVIVVGKNTPEAAERVLASGQADLIAFGRPHLADPEFANKVTTNRIEDITSCILCMKCRDDGFNPTVPGVRCSVNAALGKEAEYRIVPTKEPRNILVVGGGPAGIEAARVAALRGHRVTLWEKEAKLGGQLVYGCVPPYKDRIEVFRKYHERQLDKLGVRVELGVEVTAPSIEEFNPDALILATGGDPFSPPIPETGDIRVVQAIDVLKGTAEVGERVVIIGGGLVGCETAELLAEEGKKVTVTNILSEMALGVSPTLQGPLLDRLVGSGVRLLTNVKYECMTSEGVKLTREDGQKETLGADTVILAAGMKANKRLYENLSAEIKKVYLVGDCVSARSIRDAVAEGYKAGLNI